MEYVIKIENLQEEPYECDDCGICYPEGMNVYFNDELIYETYSDGHYSGHTSEKSILESILDKYYEIHLAEFQANITEEKRHEWNIKCPGNGVAKTPESWIAWHTGTLVSIKNDIQQIREHCAILPNNKILEVKLIAVWFAEFTSEKVEVIQIEKETSDYDDSWNQTDDYLDE